MFLRFKRLQQLRQSLKLNLNKSLPLQRLFKKKRQNSKPRKFLRQLKLKKLLRKLMSTVRKRLIKREIITKISHSENLESPESLKQKVNKDNSSKKREHQEKITPTTMRILLLLMTAGMLSRKDLLITMKEANNTALRPSTIRKMVETDSQEKVEIQTTTTITESLTTRIDQLLEIFSMSARLKQSLNQRLLKHRLLFKIETTRS